MSPTKPWLLSRSAKGVDGSSPSEGAQTPTSGPNARQYLVLQRDNGFIPPTSCTRRPEGAG
jgi:hypothetical protein